MLIMPWVTTMDVKNVGIAIIDEDCSTLSHRISSDIRASEYFTVIDEATTYNTANNLLEDCVVDIILVIPENFERDKFDCDIQLIPVKNIYDVLKVIKSQPEQKK